MVDNMTLVYQCESRGGSGIVRVEILAGLSSRALNEDDHDRIRDHGDKIVTELIMESMRLDPARIAAGACMRREMEKSFRAAGLEQIFVEEVENEYDHRPHSPWLVVTTRLGHFKVGWRSSVIMLDWSRTVVQTSAEKLFPNEPVTKGDRYIHAWSYEKLEAYLQTIAGVR